LLYTKQTQYQFERMIALLKSTLLATLAFTVVSCTSSPNYTKEDISVDLKGYRSVHIDWVDLIEEDWSRLHYGDSTEWKNDINMLNKNFQNNLKKYWLNNINLTVAKSARSSTNSRSGLLVKFREVYVDYDNYNLHLTIDYIDLNSKRLLKTVKREAYYGNNWGLTGYLSYALDEVSERITWDILQERKKNYLL